ncbi:MAG: transglycosylase domain-containing protein, partial [Actinomycetota bacterium]
MRTLGRLIVVWVVAGACLAAATAALAPQAIAVFTAGRSTIPNIDLDPLAQNSRVYDSAGNLMAVLHAEENRSPVTLDQVPDDVITTILAVEDEDFYSHGGVNLTATMRALLTNIDSGELRQGGSTITQQVVKNSLLSPKKDVNRKVKEAVLALRLEDEMEKDEILQRYVNTVYLGNGAYGMQAAGELYFGKDVEELTLADAALLAGLISNPSTYDPFTQPEAAKERRRIALDRLVDVGRITAEEAAVIGEEPIPSEPQRLLPKPDDYFVEEVKQRLLDSDLLGDTPVERYNAVFRGGLEIHTTFDPRAHFLAIRSRNEVLGDIDDVLLGGDDTTGRFTAAIATLDPRSGAVRALVGGPGFDKYKYNLA